MKLTREQIVSVAFGALEIRDEENGLRFMRCTDNQIAPYTKSEQNCTLSSSGVRLDFHTNSTKISFDAAGADLYEVMVDNLMVGHYKLNEYHEKGEVVVHDLGEGEKRVTLLFPVQGTETWLKFVELDDGATLVPHKYSDKKFYIIGDSITQGYASVYNFVALPHAISRRFNMDFVSSGVGGWHFNPVNVDKVDYDPDYALIVLGTNNWNGSKFSNTTMEQYRVTLDEFMKKFADCFPGVKTIVVSPIWRGDGHEMRPMGTFEEATAAIKEFALAQGFEFIDGLKLVPPYPEFLQDRRIHPNDIGFMVYGERLCQELEKYFL